jgi:hypothetical protein
MVNSVIELLQRKLAEHRDSVVQQITSGGVSDFAEYRYLCGVSRGLATVQLELDDLVRRLKDEDDDE